MVSFNMENVSFGKTNETKPVPAIAKAVRILEAVAEAREPLGVSELSRRSRVSKSTVHATVGALVEEGLLISENGRGYLLGSELMRLGSRARDQALVRSAEGALSKLPLSNGETALFGVVEGDRVVVLVRRESAGPLNLSAPLGSGVPLKAGALAKAYGTRRSAAYATERSEYLPGIAAAASGFDWLGGTYLLWVVGIDANYSDPELKRAGEKVQKAALKLLERLEPSAEGEASAS